MKLKVTRKGYNLRSRRREAWEAATPCGRFVAMRLEETGTPWALYDGATFVATFGSLVKVQRFINRTVQ